jgi:hypothetical protein
MTETDVLIVVVIAGLIVVVGLLMWLLERRR